MIERGNGSERIEHLAWLGPALGRIYKHIDESRWLRPSLLVGTSVVVGLLLAPAFIMRPYPTAAAMVGMPATENIKAPFDFSVDDDEITNRQRDDAVAQVRRIYDFDASAAMAADHLVEQAFHAVRTHAAAPPSHNPDISAAGRSAFEKSLGVTLDDRLLAKLKALRYSNDVELALRGLIKQVLAEPMVSERSALEPDQGRGIVMQWEHGDRKDMRKLDVLESVRDVTTVRRELPTRAMRLTPVPPAAVQSVIVDIASHFVQPTLNLNRVDTEAARASARQAVKPVVVGVKKGEMIIRDGERYTPHHLMILSKLQQNSSSSTSFLVALGAAALILVLIMTASRFATGYGRKALGLHARDALFLSSLMITIVAAARAWMNLVEVLHVEYPNIPKDVFVFAMPVAAGAMVARLVLRMDVAFLFTLIVSLLIGMLGDSLRMVVVYALIGQISGLGALRTISARGDLLRAGIWVGGIQVAAALGIHLFMANTQVPGYLLIIPSAFGSGFLAGFVALALTPVVEWLFGYTTDLKLLELSNLNHPALKELIVQAPGSYHHSVIVGALVEAAAESVGANPLLARVMAYYHDLGKGCNPGYFIENQRSGNNPHDKLKPSMSAMIIRRHVTDGIELATRYRLGAPILAGIAQHHGTTLIQYFYHRAKEQLEEGQTISEEDYRYPGQKPQSREAALVMLADSIEAAARALSEPTPARLQGLVTRIISHKFTDGQLEECDLTLRDLHTIAKSFSRVLTSIYHHRLEYPDLLHDGGKKQNGDTDSKSKKGSDDHDDPPAEGGQDNLRRLGLSGR